MHYASCLGVRLEYHGCGGCVSSAQGRSGGWKRGQTATSDCACIWTQYRCCYWPWPGASGILWTLVLVFCLPCFQFLESSCWIVIFGALTLCCSICSCRRSLTYLQLGLEPSCLVCLEMAWFSPLFSEEHLNLWVFVLTILATYNSMLCYMNHDEHMFCSETYASFVPNRHLFTYFGVWSGLAGRHG